VSRRAGRDLHGVVVVDKPAGVTSAQVVTAVRKRLGCSRVGHTGTLDPMATGVLPICLGEATKLASYLLADDKAYEAELELGLETDTLDLDGEVLARAPDAAAAVTEAAIRAALPRFVGVIQQVPPMYSAIRLDGRRLHQLARAGVEVEREPRTVTIHRLDLLAFEPPRIRLAVACSKGTYVRSLVADLGTALGCGAALSALRRTQSGLFTLATAAPLTDLHRASVIEPARILSLPTLVVPAALHRAVLDGRLINPTSCTPPSENPPSTAPVCDGKLNHGLAYECVIKYEYTPSMAPREGGLRAAGADDAEEAGTLSGDAPTLQLVTPDGALLALARPGPDATIRPLRVFTYGLTIDRSSANLARSNNP